MSVSLLGGALPFGVRTDQGETKDKKSSRLPFASLFEAASNQAKRSADKSILDSAQPNQSLSAITAGGPVAPLDLRRDAEAALGNLNRRLQQLFQDADVDTSVDIQLVGNGSGGVDIVGSHPDDDKIKELLSAHPELVEQFHEMMELFAKLQASTPNPLGATQGGVLAMIISQQNARVAMDTSATAVE